jgi:hypothetical protein
MNEGTSFWKVAGTFIAVIGAVAIIFQLNQGTLAQTGANTLGGIVGDMFASVGGNGSNNAPGTTGAGSHTDPSGNAGGGNKTPHSTQYTNV